MAEEMKHLIEQIQKEGVDKAEQEAQSILKQAKEKAASIIKEAEKKAEDTLAKAKVESEAFAQRSTKTLEQAARDLLITVGQGCEKVVSGVLFSQVEAAFKGELLEKMILNLIEQNADSSIEISVSEDDKQALAVSCSALLQSRKETIVLKSDSDVLSGFKVGFKDKSVYLDYTGEAVAEALSAYLRPELAQVVSKIAKDQMLGNNAKPTA